ncbi:MAG TPA: APC family permease [Acidobacteriaceae bacterium]|jgi:amino acid transporter|nr:APC family permease [Acidobacteriaceae bacterium]
MASEPTAPAAEDRTSAGPSAPGPGSSAAAPHLERLIGLPSAITLNMMYMIGVGPFITLPLIVAAMGGSQALLGWLLGAFIGVCDGLTWAELGAAMPEAGGSYTFLREIYGREGPGRFFSFLYIFQLGFSAPLSIASGCIGFAEFASFLFPRLRLPVIAAWPNGVHWTSLLAAAACALIVGMLYRDIRAILRTAWVLWAGVMAAMAIVILAGFTHLHPALLHLPPHAFSFSPGFFAGLGSATLIATYDYWGYYNVCFIGGEIREPGKTIPRAVLFSIAVVAVLYICMNISVLGVIPANAMGKGLAAETVISRMVASTLGPTAAVVVTCLIMWTAFSSVFALLMGYSRVPYAAALDGNYFRIFAHLHPKRNFPDFSLLALGAVAIVFCFFRLVEVIAALVVIRIVLQYLLQQVGVIVLRIRRPDMPRPFRLWFYPLPPLLALAGFLFILFSRTQGLRELLFAVAIALLGSALYFTRARSRGEWPFKLNVQGGRDG